MKACLVLFLSLFLGCTAAVALPPSEWEPTDYPAEPPGWLAVEVARFPSELLAEGTRGALEEAGWGPVRLRGTQGGEVAVLVGEVSDTGTAWFLRDELEHLRVAKGRLVQVAAEPGVSPRGFTGPLSRAYEVAIPRATEDRLMRELGQRLGSLPEEDQTAVARTVSGYLDDTTAPERMAEGAIRAAANLWQAGRQPELALLLSSRVASGTWPAGEDAPLVDEMAREIAFELIYGEQRDWRGAWRITQETLDTATRDVDRARALMRQAALLVDLIDRRVSPAPSFADVRVRLRRAHELAPSGERGLQARIGYLYIRTFTWEGNWERVEALASAFGERHGDVEPYASLARVLVAKSYERGARIEDALAILTEVAGKAFPHQEYLRMGMTMVDPAQVALRERARFLEMIGEEPGPLPQRPAADRSGDEILAEDTMPPREPS